MKTIALAAFAALLVGSPVWAAELGNGKPTYVDSQKVLDNFGKANLLVPGDGAYEVQTNRRVKNGNIEIHVKETDIFYVMDGSATLLIGGTAVDPHPGLLRFVVDTSCGRLKCRQMASDGWSMGLDGKLEQRTAWEMWATAARSKEPVR